MIAVKSEAQVLFMIARPWEFVTAPTPWRNATKLEENPKIRITLITDSKKIRKSTRHSHHFFLHVIQILSPTISISIIQNQLFQLYQVYVHLNHQSFIPHNANPTKIHRRVSHGLSSAQGVGLHSHTNFCPWAPLNWACISPKATSRIL